MRPSSYAVDDTATHTRRERAGARGTGTLRASRFLVHTRERQREATREREARDARIPSACEPIGKHDG